MTLDIVALVLALMFIYMGWRSGAVSQCMRVIAAVVAFMAASPVSRIINDLVFPATDLSGPVLEAMMLVASGILVYMALAVTGWLFARALWAASDGVTLLDRSGGASLGLLKSAILVYFLVAAVAMMRAPLERVDEKDVLHLRDSHLLGWVERHNVLVAWRFGDLQRLHDALKVDRAAEESRAARLVRQRADASDFLTSDEIKALKEDEAVVDAAVDDVYYRTLADPRVREYLNDEEFVARLRLVEWDVLLDEIEQKGEGEEASTT